MDITRASGLAVAAIVLSIGTAAAIERTTLPAFALTDPSGHTISSHELARAGNWLLIYVGADCPPCESVLKSLEQDENGTLPLKIVVVVNAPAAEDLERIVRRHPSLAGASWYADAAGAAQALRMTSMPAVFGVHDRSIEWSVAGVLIDPTDIKAIMSSWLAAGSAPQ